MFKIHYKSLLVLSVILIMRLLSVVVVRSSFVPDEYWQSLEVAHKMTFGYGHLTWEWKKKIRSYIYPFMIHTLYSVFPESVETIVILPKIFQAVLSAIGDFFTYKLSCKLFGPRCGLWTLFNLLTSWFLFYCSSRTLTNMAEASFTACGLYFYPWNGKKLWNERFPCTYLWFAGISVLIRPTAIVFWLPLYVTHFWHDKNHIYVIKNTFVCGCAILAALLSCDRYFYGKWVLTPYNFFILNWSNDIGAFYGQHNFLWYFFAGFPVVLGVHMIPFLIGLSLPRLKFLYYAVLWMITIFSLLSHKEFRFLLPVLPIALIICGAVMKEIESREMTILKWKVNKVINMCLVCLILLVNIPFSVYMGLTHQNGTTDATLKLSKMVNRNSNVLFLMPCHSTPYYSYVHQNITMKFLSCEPNFDNVKNYKEEADIFFTDPNSWLTEHYDQNDGIEMPSHIVMFDTLHYEINEFLTKHSYKLCYKTFHSHFPESRTGQFVFICCR